MARSLIVTLLAGGLLLLLTTAASAHAGRNPAPAVDDRARITAIEPHDAPFEVRVVDGDQELWLRIQPGNELVVLGSFDEPFLRFKNGSVTANTRSPTAETDLFGLVPSRPSLDPRTPPTWWNVAKGNSYLWHDHRLHALALVSPQGPARRLGSWVVPLRLNGGHAAIVGKLWSVAPPALWVWLAIPLAIVVAALALLRFGSAAAVRRSAPLVAAATTAAVVIARNGRDLYGRPQVTTGRYVSIAIGLAVALFILERLLRGGAGIRLVVTMVVGVVALVQGLTLLPSFWHGLVLAALPGWIERCCVAVALGGGIAALVFAFVDEQGQSGPRGEAAAVQGRAQEDS
jgi:hypothetical protein